MATKDFKRKLSAILSADVAGYSRLMGEDEAATVSTLETYREVMSTLIKQHRGRVVDSPGDNVLAEFGSVVDAVQCGVAVQNEFQARNAELPENRRMQFRIGINLGDVIEEGDRIYGDGVNIAARLEALANPGGICISKTAFDHIETKLPLGYEYLGDQTVKNIAKPVGAYRVLMEPRITVAGEKEKAVPIWRRKVILAGGVALALVVIAALIWNFYFRPPPIEPASVEKMAFPLPKKPSIAVLPFDNLSGDPDQEYFSDGLAENIITQLSQIHNLFIISRNSTFTYKGKPVKVNQVAEELGVRYVLEGSVQGIKNRVRVTAQLIDATTGRHLWADRYDRELKDIFSIQDEITHNIITEMAVKLAEGENERLMQKPTQNVKAWGYYRRAVEQFRIFTKEANLKAREFSEKAIELEPEYSEAYSLLGWTYAWPVRTGISNSPKEDLKRAKEFVNKAKALDSFNSDAQNLLGFIYVVKGQYDRAIEEGQRAIELAPNTSDTYALLSLSFLFSGRSDEAIAAMQKAMRLAPFYPRWFLTSLGQSYFVAGQYEEAKAAFKHFLKERPEHLSSCTWLAVIYSVTGREDQARAQIEQVMSIKPTFCLEEWRKGFYPWKNREEVERILDIARKAGIPDKPPLPLPDKPSIAVLPFVNMSGDSEQEYFSDGITESIITALSKVEKLFVIARNSTFTYKGKPVKVQQVAKDLGVQYVLEGSVQRSADRIRITAQFVDARKGHHLWAERYDRDLKDLFALQDEITMKIITALEVKLTEGEQALVAGSGTDNLDAYLKILQARDLKRHQTIENNRKARRFAEEAIKLDPDFAQAYRWLSGTYLIDVWLGSTKSPRESLRKAVELAQKALSLDDSLGGAHGLLGNIYIMRKEYERGIREVERAVELEPNGADAHVFLGMGLVFADRAEEAILILKKAIRLDPHTPGWYMHILATAYRDIQKYEEAIEWGEKAVQQNPENVLSRKILCSIYSLAGRMDEARVQAKEIMRINPKFSVDRVARTDPQKNQVIKKRYIDALRKAGLK